MIICCWLLVTYVLKILHSKDYNTCTKYMDFEKTYTLTYKPFCTK